MEKSEDGKVWPSICVIGAGFSGLCAGIKLKTKLGLKNFTIFDEQEEVGGTWFQHIFPKCNSDVPSVFYSFSFEPNPNWSQLFCPQKETLEYMKSVARKHDLYSNLKLSHQIQSLQWEKNLLKWRVKVYDKINGIAHELFFDIVIGGPGGLRIPNIPEEFKTFEGPIMHSAKWDPSLDLEGKNVAVIGSGTSAIQVIPGIVDKVKKLYSFQRRPAWVAPKPEITFSERTKRVFTKVPALQKALRSSIFLTYEATWPGLLKDSVNNKFAMWLCNWHMRKQLKDRPDLQKKLSPDYKFGCKRPGVSNDYYPALARDHVEVIREKISDVKGQTLTTDDGKCYPVDILILTTGYDINDYFAPTDIIGTTQSDILETWRQDGPSHYLGIVNHDAPNFFLLCGPNTAAAHSSAVFPIECQMNWIIKVLKRMINQKWDVVKVEKSAQDRYMNKTLKELEGTVFGAYGQSCNSFYANQHGIVQVVHQGSNINYWRKTRKVNFSKLQFSGRGSEGHYNPLKIED